MTRKHKNKSNLGKTLKKVFLWTMAIFFGSSLFFTLLYRFINPPVTPIMIIRLFDQIKEDQALRLSKDWVDLEDISPKMVQAVVAGEDNLFLTHHGFDWKAIERARQHNENGKRIHGGSTISQQTAKNVFLWPNRSYIRKGFEVYFTFLIETLWPKERIMEVYLNIIETGKGIYGVEMAAQTYYHKSAKKLSSSQAAMITTILPAPRKRNPSHPSSYMYRQQARIQNLMRKIGPVHFH
ncbi:MAG: monofunctional biosynthetic peptidoglycan transglycosylase [Bacteroidales bacterium]